MPGKRGRSNTQKHLGRHQLIARLSAQVGDEKTALAILRKRGHVDEQGKLTASGKRRDAMTAKERAIDRESKKTGNPKKKYVYNKKTNRATLKKGRRRK